MTEEDWSNTVETSARLLYPFWYWRNSISTCLSQLRSSPPHLCDYCEGGRTHKSKSSATTHLLPVCTLLAYIVLPCSIRQYCTSPHGIHCISVPDNMYVHTELPYTLLCVCVCVYVCTLLAYILLPCSILLQSYVPRVRACSEHANFTILYYIVCNTVCMYCTYVCMYNVHSFCTCLV